MVLRIFSAMSKERERATSQGCQDDSASAVLHHIDIWSDSSHITAHGRRKWKFIRESSVESILLLGFSFSNFPFFFLSHVISIYTDNNFLHLVLISLSMDFLWAQVNQNKLKIASITKDLHGSFMNSVNFQNKKSTYTLYALWMQIFLIKMNNFGVSWEKNDLLF